MNTPPKPALLTRRTFLAHSAALAATAVGPVGLAGCSSYPSASKAPLYEISLAQWSLHKALFAKQVNHLDFAKMARRDFGIGAVEYVNQFFMDKARDKGHLDEMKRIAEGEGVKNVLIMCDGEGSLGDPDTAQRKRAVEPNPAPMPPSSRLPAPWRSSWRTMTRS